MATNSAALAAAATSSPSYHLQQQQLQQQQQQQQQQHHCKDCGLYFESGKSLEVHFQYHKENLLSKWATQAQQTAAQNDLENNNNSSSNNNGAGAGGGGAGGKVKREAPSAPADDAMMTKPSPEFQQRATPETSAPFGHPATPQSYHSAPSPYQTPEQTGFSPGHHFAPYGPPPFGAAAADHAQQQQLQQQPTTGAWDQNHHHQYEYAVPPTHHHPHHHRHARFHPYGAMPERSSHVSSTSPVYGQAPTQPTPSPSPKQCDKCGFVCDSAQQLNEHCSTSHPPTPQNHFRQQQQGYTGAQQQPQPGQKHYSNFNEAEAEVKEEQEETADILDLDSQKVVHPGGEENGIFEHHHQQQQHHHGHHGAPPPPPPHHNGPNPHSVSAMLSWPDRFGHAHMNGDSSSHEHKAYEQKMYAHEQKPFAHLHDQKLYQPHQMMGVGEYSAGPSTGPTSTRPDLMQAPSARQDMSAAAGAYRPFDSPAGAQISSSQPTSNSNVPAISGRGANWKSNEARRPKTYNCTACNKWFTSSGHLKRHYNTTLHKNAVRSSGQPDPATMPISTHHHPAREPAHGRGSQQQQQQQSGPDPSAHSPLPSDDVRSPEEAQPGSQFASPAFDRSVKGSYMHHHPNSVPNSNNPLANHPLPHQIGAHPLAMGNHQPPGLGNPLDAGHHPQGAPTAGDQSGGGSLNSSVGGSPNGLAGPSVHLNHHSRGLLSVSINNAISPLSAHSIPPFGHLPANAYNPAADHTAIGAQDAPSIYLAQNFQQNIAPNHPNAMSPHVMDTASSITSTIGEIKAEQLALEVSGPLPSFAQIQSQRYGIVPDYSSMHNVGGSSPDGDPVAQLNGYAYMDAADAAQFSDASNLSENSDYILPTIDTPRKRRFVEVEVDIIKRDGTDTMSFDDAELSQHRDFIQHEMLMIKQETDVSNKENYESHVAESSPIPIEYDDNNGSPSVTSTTATSTTTMMPVNSMYVAVTNVAVGASDGSLPIGVKQQQQLLQPLQQPLHSSNKQQPPPLTKAQAAKAAARAAKAAEIHKCFECDKLFNRACYLTQHNKSFHSGAKPFKCSRCGKRFPDDATYARHWLKHAGDKPFKCDLCPKQFNHKTDLRRHMCLHSGEKPFACYHCGKGFIRKDHMVKHYETHQRAPRAPSYKAGLNKAAAAQAVAVANKCA